jgi:Uma2 family endonuclease
MTVAPLPDWVIPPPGGFTAEDFLRLPGLPPHTELIDGSLIFVSPQQKWHSRVVNLLLRELDAQAPPHLRADREMVVRLGKRQAPEPDVVVVTGEAFDRPEPATYYWPADVVLAIEAVSPDSEDRDRETKPRKYAAAGIKHFWRVENDEGQAVAYTYERDPATGCYGLTGIHHGRLKTSVPFTIDIDLDTVDARHR